MAYRLHVFDRYSADAIRAVELATEEARQLGHDHVGTEHLLLGLLGERDATAARALVAGGASLALCREKVVEALASRSKDRLLPTSEPLPFTDRATRTLERASRLSARLGRDDVLTEDVLLSLLDVEGTAGQVLRGLSVDFSAVRRALTPAGEREEKANRPEPEPPAAAASEPAQGPTCGNCGSALETSLARHEIRNANVVVVYCTVCGTAIGTV